MSCKSIVDLGHSLNIEVVAEGVETLDQAEALTACGCDYLQGYYFAKPQTVTQLEELSFATAKEGV